MLGSNCAKSNSNARNPTRHKPIADSMKPKCANDLTEIAEPDSAKSNMGVKQPKQARLCTGTNDSTEMLSNESKGGPKHTIPATEKAGPDRAS